MSVTPYVRPSRAKTRKCPCCDAPMTVQQSLDVPRLSLLQQTVVNVTRDAAPRRVTADALIFAVWGGRNEPALPRKQLSVMVWQINRKLAPYGFKISCGGGHGDGYLFTGPEE